MFNNHVFLYKVQLRSNSFILNLENIQYTFQMKRLINILSLYISFLDSDHFFKTPLISKHILLMFYNSYGIIDWHKHLGV